MLGSLVPSLIPSFYRLQYEKRGGLGTRLHVRYGLCYTVGLSSLGIAGVVGWEKAVCQALTDSRGSGMGEGSMPGTDRYGTYHNN